jgi:uncharacterized protein YjbI with pentapeptide repeats
MRGALLRHAELSSANLTSAHMRHADLSDAQMIGTRLTAADLEGADLRAAILIQSRLTRANLRYADLRDACLVGADLRGARGLEQAHLTGVIYDDTTRWPTGFELPTGLTKWSPPSW